MIAMGARKLTLLVAVLAVGLAACVSSGKAEGPICQAGSPVASRQRLETDGARLFLAVYGPRCDAPVLLWLHGGPGGPERPLFRHFTGELERSFNVAYLDQRGAGLSYDDDADPSRLTIAQHERDLDRVVDWLRAQFPGQPLSLVGHSWGAALGLLYARDHADKVAAVVAVAPLVASIDQQRAELAFVEAEARRRDDDDVLDEVKKLGAPPLDAREVLRLERISENYGGVFHQRPDFTTTMLSGLARGLIAPWDIWRFIEGNNVSLEAMNAELSQLDLRSAVPALNMPAIFMLGRHDHHLDSGISASYFAALDSHHKELLWFEGSAHNIPFEQPDDFKKSLQEALLKIGIAPSGPTEGH